MRSWFSFCNKFSFFIFVFFQVLKPHSKNGAGSGDPLADIDYFGAGKQDERLQFSKDTRESEEETSDSMEHQTCSSGKRKRGVPEKSVKSKKKKSGKKQTQGSQSVSVPPLVMSFISLRGVWKEHECCSALEKALLIVFIICVVGDSDGGALDVGVQQVEDAGEGVRWMSSLEKRAEGTRDEGKGKPSQKRLKHLHQEKVRTHTTEILSTDSLHRLTPETHSTDSLHRLTPQL